MSIAPKGPADELELGTWNAVCAVCGRKFKANTMVKLPPGISGAWSGDQYVCKKDYRPRQPQDFVRGIPEKMAAPWVQAPVDTYAEFCTTVSAVADYAIADCAIADNTTIPAS